MPQPNESDPLAAAPPPNQNGTVAHKDLHPTAGTATLSPSPESAAVNVAVVGLGYWGPNLVRVLLQHRGANLLTVCDRKQERLATMQQRHHIRGTQNLDQILHDPAIEAVIVATPISTHHSVGMAALEAGKHVFIEKPLAASGPEAEELVLEAEARGLTLMVGHTFEYSPPVIRAKQIIERGELGKIFYISSTRVNLGLHQSDASVIWDLAPHDFSILCYWLNEQPISVSAFGKAFIQPGIPDVAFIDLTFASGTVAHTQVSWLAPGKLRRTTIVGSQKMLVYDDTQVDEKIKIFDSGVDLKNPETFGEYQLTYRAGDIVSPRLETQEPLVAEMGHFLDCVRTSCPPRSDGHSGLRVVRALEAAEASLRNQGQVVHIPTSKIPVRLPRGET